MKELNKPTDLPIGTILINYYANMMAFFKVLKTTEKSVVVQELEFETGPSKIDWLHRTIKPKDEFDRYSKPKRKMVKFLKDGGFAVPDVIGHGSMSIYDPESEYTVYWD